jgi:hypothetical protein
LKKFHHKKKRAGEVAQDVGPESAKKKRKKKRNDTIFLPQPLKTGRLLRTGCHFGGILLKEMRGD